MLQPATGLALAFAARRGTLDATLKSPGQFVSEADHAVEDAIRASLADAFGTVPILGEEGGGGLDDGSGWAIDPIDGTTNFLCGLPLWGISAGLMQGGAPIAGIVVLPELDLTLTARRGDGLWCNGVRLAPHRMARAAKLMALGENPHERAAETDARANHYRDRGYTVVRYNCAVFSLANVALGRLDGYIEHGCSLWDIAAGWLLCLEAGVPTAATALGEGRYAIQACRL